jgi:hypothetical protein
MHTGLRRVTGSGWLCRVSAPGARHAMAAWAVKERRIWVSEPGQ